MQAYSAESAPRHKLPSLSFGTREQANLPSRTEQLGDLASHSPQTTRDVINASLARFAAHHPEIDNGMYPYHIQHKAQTLEAGINRLRDVLADEKQTDAYQLIQAKYAEADRESFGKSPAERFAHRLSKFSKIHVVTDFDGTMTEDPNDYLLRIPGSVLGEHLLKQNGRESFAYASALSWVHPLEKTPDAFRDVGRTVKLRDGVSKFMNTASSYNIRDITVLSANFEPIIIGGLDQLGEQADGVRVIAVKHDDICSTDKGTILALLALQDPDAAIVFIGDGASDKAALDAHDVVAGFGALEDEGFAMQLATFNQTGTAPYFTYGNFHDVLEALQLAQTRKDLYAVV